MRFIAIVLGLSFLPAQAGADAWLDRVEKNLRRLQSASEHIEVKEIGSTDAAHYHARCVRQGIESACDKVIWSDPSVGNVRPWAVGVAHIKRGEMREARGDIFGAIRDYNDALSYHEFPLVKQRIERLEKVAAQVSDGIRQEQRRQATPEPAAASAGDKDTPGPHRHPVVVLDGWAASLAALKEAGGGAGAAEDDVAAQAAPPDIKPNNPKVIGDDIAAGDEEPSSNPELRHGGQSGGHSGGQSAGSPGVRLTPGRFAAETELARKSDQQGRGPVQDARPVAPVRMSSEATGVEGNLEAAPRKPAPRDLSERAPIGSRITTSALPSPKVRAPDFTALYTTLVAVVLALLAWAFRYGRELLAPILAGNPQTPGPGLSPREIAELVKRQSRRAAPRPAPAPPLPLARKEDAAVLAGPTAMPRTRSQAVARQPARAGPREEQAKADEAVSSETTQAPGNETSSRTQAVSGEDAASSPPVPAQQQEPPGRLVRPEKRRRAAAMKPGLSEDIVSVVRRLPYGAASVVVIEGGSNITRRLFDAVSEQDRDALWRRRVELMQVAPETKGLLNLFQETGVCGQCNGWQTLRRFNSLFEYHTVSLSALVGPSFINEHRVALRHIFLLMKRMERPDLIAFRDLLQTRKLAQFEAHLSSIESSAARLFLATEFVSPDFERPASILVKALDWLLAQKDLVHLFQAIEEPMDLEGRLDKGQLFLLDSTSPGKSAACDRFVALSLMASLARTQYDGEDHQSRQATRTVIIDEKSALFETGTEEVLFLIGELRKAGFSVVRHRS